MSRQTDKTLTRGTSSVGDGREAVVSGFVLRLARESIGDGCSRERFAEMLGVSLDTMAGWETGRRPLTAVRAGQFVAVKSTLMQSGAAPSLVLLLDSAMEADQILDFALRGVDAHEIGAAHPLGSFVHRREVVELAAWPLSGKPPAVASTLPRARRGPVAPGPVVDDGSRNVVFDHLRCVADFSREGDSLLYRQALYLLSYDRRDDAAEWMRDQYRRVPRRRGGWSPEWPVLRTLATSLVRYGDPSALLDFTDAGLADEQGHTANLNYWAYWVGETRTIERDDSFMPTRLGPWRGDVILRHLAARLDAEHGVADLGIHTLRTLLAARPRLLEDDPVTTADLVGIVERVLDAGRMSPTARQALAEVRYALRLYTR